MVMRQPSRRPQQRSELADALAACRGAFISIGLMAGMSNILMLTGAFFMLEIYDRVLPSRSIPTLVGLVILAAGLYTAPFSDPNPPTVTVMAALAIDPSETYSATVTIVQTNPSH